MLRRLKLGGLAALAVTFVCSPALADWSASSTITRQQLGSGSYEYDLTLTDTGTTPIGTFWFGWVPGYDLLPHAPASISSPPGWTGTNAPDYYGIASAQWVNTTNPLQPGQSLSGFKFDSPDSNLITGTSSFFGLAIEESYVYIGAPQTDAGFSLSPNAVTPEPASLALFAAPAVLLLRHRLR